MLTPFDQNWRISTMPYALSLANAVSTGGSFTTPSNAVANTKWFAQRGLQGYGPRVQYPNRGMDGLGNHSGGSCGCGCGGHGSCNGGGDGGWITLLIAGAAVATIWMCCSRKGAVGSPISL